MLVDRSQVFRSLAQRRNGLFQFCFRQRDDLALLLQFLGQFSLPPFEVGEMRAALDQVVSLEPRRRRSRRLLAYLVAQFPNRLQSISLLHFSQTSPGWRSPFPGPAGCPE